MYIYIYKRIGYLDWIEHGESFLCDTCAAYIDCQTDELQYMYDKDLCYAIK